MSVSLHQLHNSVTNCEHLRFAIRCCTRSPFISSATCPIGPRPKALSPAHRAPPPPLPLGWFRLLPRLMLRLPAFRSGRFPLWPLRPGRSARPLASCLGPACSLVPRRGLLRLAYGNGGPQENVSLFCIQALLTLYRHAKYGEAFSSIYKFGRGRNKKVQERSRNNSDHTTTHQRR